MYLWIEMTEETSCKQNTWTKIGQELWNVYIFVFILFVNWKKCVVLILWCVSINMWVDPSCIGWHHHRCHGSFSTTNMCTSEHQGLKHISTSTANGSNNLPSFAGIPDCIQQYTDRFLLR